MRLRMSSCVCMHLHAQTCTKMNIRARLCTIMREDARRCTNRGAQNKICAFLSRADLHRGMVFFVSICPGSLAPYCSQYDSLGVSGTKCPEQRLWMPAAVRHLLTLLFPRPRPSRCWPGLRLSAFVCTLPFFVLRLCHATTPQQPPLGTATCASAACAFTACACAASAAWPPLGPWQCCSARW